MYALHQYKYNQKNYLYSQMMHLMNPNLKYEHFYYFQIYYRYLFQLDQKKFDFLSNSITRTFPDGLDIEIFKKKVSINTYKKAKKNFDKEHVTPYMIRNFKCFDYKNKIDFSYKRWTLDTEKDHKKIRKIFNKFKERKFFSWKEILNHGF